MKLVFLDGSEQSRSSTQPHDQIRAHLLPVSPRNGLGRAAGAPKAYYKAYRKTTKYYYGNEHGDRAWGSVSKELFFIAHEDDQRVKKGMRITRRGPLTPTGRLNLHAPPRGLLAMPVAGAIPHYDMSSLSRSLDRAHTSSS